MAAKLFEIIYHTSKFVFLLFGPFGGPFSASKEGLSSKLISNLNSVGSKLYELIYHSQKLIFFYSAPFGGHFLASGEGLKPTHSKFIFIDSSKNIKHHSSTKTYSIINSFFNHHFMRKKVLEMLQYIKTSSFIHIPHSPVS